MTDLKGLIERVRAATGPDRELDFLIQILVAHPLTGNEPYTFQDVMDDFALLGPEGMTIDGPYTASIDAIVALIERKLPGRDWDIAPIGDGRWLSGIRPTREMLRAQKFTVHGGSAATPCLALVLALLAALDTGGGEG